HQGGKKSRYCSLLLQHLIWTLLQTAKRQSPGECDVQPKARENCGYAGITEIECSARQCCFNSDAPDSPWCFKPVPSEGKCFSY
uniref:P-type domain-containing protein n=1 Tax=Gopherus evgoodei TaxID=1825980 RepID=A0A8C4VJG1_9SAUR